MNLGISERYALGCFACKGLGLACAQSLAAEGAVVTIVARGAEALEALSQVIRKATGGVVYTVAADNTTPEGCSAALAISPSPDILMTNAGGPKPGDFRDRKSAHWFAALDANIFSSIALIKATLDGMISRRFGSFVNITSGVVKAPIYFLGLSHGARSGLTGFMAGLSRKTVTHNVAINNLLPGLFETARLRETARHWALQSGTSEALVLSERRETNPAGRFGTPAEFGDACAYLCSAQAGFISGHNLLLGAGFYRGNF